MTSGRCAFITAAMLLSAGPSAAAVIVPPVRVQAPSCITLVGSNAGVPATSLGRFEVVIRDIANNPIFNSPVVVDLSGCDDLWLCTDQLDPGLVVHCATRTVEARTDVRGVATFTLLGGSRGYSAGSPSSQGAKGKIYVPAYPDYGVTVAVSAYDLDGFMGVGANDFSNWLADFGSSLPWARSDYDCSGTIGANDLSLWLEGFASGLMAQNCTSHCP